MWREHHGCSGEESVQVEGEEKDGEEEEVATDRRTKRLHLMVRQSMKRRSGDPGRRSYFLRRADRTERIARDDASMLDRRSPNGLERSHVRAEPRQADRARDRDRGGVVRVPMAPTIGTAAGRTDPPIGRGGSRRHGEACCGRDGAVPGLRRLRAGAPSPKLRPRRLPLRPEILGKSAVCPGPSRLDPPPTRA